MRYSLVLILLASGELLLTPCQSFSVVASRRGLQGLAKPHSVPSYPRSKIRVHVSSSDDIASLESRKKENEPPHLTLKGKKLTAFGAVYGAVAISVGMLWWIALSVCDVLYRVLGQERVDPLLAWPITLSHTWGALVLGLTNCAPEVQGREHVDDLLRRRRGGGNDLDSDSVTPPVMFVANHCSYMDIPILCLAIGWQNYKIIAKEELLKIPVLGKSLKMGGHLILDRGNRRSQLETYKKGIQWLKDGVHLVSFAEGTRSRTGRLQPFKKGAFKMAQAAGAPIVPVSICHSNKVQPTEYLFPVVPSRSVPLVLRFGDPIWTTGKSEEEIADEVWHAMVANLPEDQRPEQIETQSMLEAK